MHGGQVDAYALALQTPMHLGRGRTVRKHHAAYVKGSNDTLDQLAEARDKGDYSALVGLEKTLAFNLSGHVLHSMFWNNLRPGSSADRPEGDLEAAITERFDAARAAGNPIIVAP
ncbi:hypothetical protein ACFY36_37470 [Actinoplanes sp. NPDC000266]